MPWLVGLQGSDEASGQWRLRYNAHPGFTPPFPHRPANPSIRLQLASGGHAIVDAKAGEENKQFYNLALAPEPLPEVQVRPSTHPLIYSMHPHACHDM